MGRNFTVYMTGFHQIRPRFEGTQGYGVDWLTAAHTAAERQLQQHNQKFDSGHFQEQMRRFIKRYGCGEEKIARRGHELEDFLHQSFAEMKVFNVHKSPTGAGMEVRMALFSDSVNAVFSKFYEEISEPPIDLIHVTCTGYISPSGAQRVVNQKGWQGVTTVTHAYHMGCYASIPALRMATGFLATAQLRSSSHASTGSVDIVHTELCTLHMNPTQHTPEQLVVQSLFADGFIKYSLVASSDSALVPSGAWEIVAVREEMVEDSLGAMTWQCADFGMKMGLAREVPQLIARALPQYLRNLGEQAGLCIESEKSSCVFAVHPGGPKIIDNVQELLALEDWQVAESKRVLFDYGNMSSATLPHVWQRLLEDESVPKGQVVVSLAFGPGLSICGAVLRKV